MQFPVTEGAQTQMSHIASDRVNCKVTAWFSAEMHAIYLNKIFQHLEKMHI